MKSAKITINPTEVKSVSYNNSFRQKPGQPMKLMVKSQVNIQTNPAAPTTAMAMIKITAEDEEKNLTLAIETMTLASASTFIDNLDDIIKAKYLPVIMLGVNEKIRNISSTLGINLRLPSPQLDYTQEEERPESGPVYYS